MDKKVVEYIYVCVFVYVCVYIYIIYIYIMKYYSTTKNEILPFVATSVNLECIRLSEIS